MTITQTSRVITRYGTQVVIEDDAGTPLRCHTRRRTSGAVCGDRVNWLKDASGSCVLTQIRPRRNEVTRRDRHGRLRTIAANIDQLVIVFAPVPKPQWDLIDRYLVAASALGAHALLVLNKLELLDTESPMAEALTIYAEAGYALLAVSAKTGRGIEDLAHALRSRTNILVGQSGVGKSALVSKFHPHLDIRIGTLSEGDRSGKHTTVRATLYHLPGGGDLIDSPGVRSFEPPSLTQLDLEKGFIEFGPFLGHCRYHNCTHTSEPGCAISAAAQEGKIDARRLASYRQLSKSSSTG